MYDSPHGLAINKNKEPDESEPEGKKECSLANSSYGPLVILQTLVVRLRGKNKERFVRVLIDTGSQRSYISKYAASLMNLESFGEEKICHSLLGGSEIEENHNKYLIHVSDIQNTYHCNFKVLDQNTICSGIPRTDISSFDQELKKRKIFLTDTSRIDDLIFENSENEIHILIGADIAGKLFTDRLTNLASGLTCLETLLEWTVIGKTDKTETSNSSLLVLSLHVTDAKISDLRTLDSLQIEEDNVKHNKLETQEFALESFRKTVCRDSSSRFKVNLPWLYRHPTLQDDKTLDQKRLKYS
ncbi:integrase catalytic domain-containing protein [Trichonephila clavata]|uniref:Integrase catalytic domain-containing protein n=1 Tax=Trichonephila clavata TaxID=2740835 RepID=A0A8X6LU72_TRICU|nr:integrase catalytic domain-containing protein [Trichonephila clavata]